MDKALKKHKTIIMNIDIKVLRKLLRKTYIDKIRNVQKRNHNTNSA